MTFRLRTALVVLVLTAGTMGAAFFLVWESFVASQRHQLDLALLGVAKREAAEAAEGALEFSDAPGPSANAVGPLPKYGVIYSADGRVLSSTGNFHIVPSMPGRPSSEDAFDFEHEGHPMRGVLLELEGRAKTHRLFLSSPREDLEDDGGILARAMTIAWLVGCGWAAVVGYGVAKRLTAEHRVVEGVARRVASGDTSARIDFRSSDTELRQLAADLNAMIERLVGLVASQERFVSHAAHELRTPHAALRLEIELALRTCREPSEYAQALGGALESAKRLSALSEDLLELARIDAVPSHEKCDLWDAITDARADVLPLARARAVELRLELSGPSPSVRGARRALGRVFRNLLENAVRFSPEDAHVSVEVRETDETVTVRIVDLGPGIRSGDEERIFEPFVRAATSSEGHSEGKGLGLSIARQLAQAAGGNVRAEVTSPGAVMVVSLLRAKSEPS